MICRDLIKMAREKHDASWRYDIKNRACAAKLWLTAMSLLLIAGCASVKQPAANGVLQGCPSAPRCVSSEETASARQRVAPIPLGALSVMQARTALLIVIEEMGGQVGDLSEDNVEGFITASFSSSLLGFVDDLTCRIDLQMRVIHLRSESRVGFYDLGTNRRRVHELRQRLGVLMDSLVADGAKLDNI